MPNTNKDLRKLTIPLVFKQLLAIFVGMVDTINILVINITAALATGGTVVAVHYLKQKDTENVSKAAWQFLLFYAVLFVMVTVILLATHWPLLRVIFGREESAIMGNASI